MKGWLFTICMVTALVTGCSRFHASSPAFEEANLLFSQGSYQDSLARYDQIIEETPTMADRALFEMGVVYASSKNEQRNDLKALQCFQRIVEEYPASPYLHDSKMMIFHLRSGALKDKTIAVQQKQIEALQHQMESQTNNVLLLEKEIEALQQKLLARVNREGPADKILIEKKQRRLTLLSRGEVIKIYRIALGGTPDGPKEREGDNRTPEGSYVIDSRSKNSPFHLALHISYPNERDKKRAKELGVSPGGNIMIHGIKKGFAWVGNSHADVDWTQGCIAVTDAEIEEIEKLTPNGTVVEIMP